MVHSIFARQDSSLLEHLQLASVLFDNAEPNTICLQIWASSENLPPPWLSMLSFDLLREDGLTISCRAEYLGMITGAECFSLTPQDAEADLNEAFSVPGDAFCLSVQWVEAVTMGGARKRLANDALSLKAFPCADIFHIHPSDLKPGK
ncbi:MAG: hypothetical protein WC766_03230 [Patescibacteria group bacterium]|jgi:hypothetical protein